MPLLEDLLRARTYSSVSQDRPTHEYLPHNISSACHRLYDAAVKYILETVKELNSCGSTKKKNSRLNLLYLYVLPGFRLDPADQLERVRQELSSLHQVHAANPILGVDYQEEASVSGRLWFSYLYTTI